MKKLYSAAFLLPLVAIAAAVMGMGEPDLDIVKDGKTDYVIEISDRSVFAQTAAASRLDKTIKSKTGADLGLVTDKKTSPELQNKIIIGSDGGSAAVLHYDDILIQAKDRDLLIFSENSSRYNEAVDFVADLVEGNELSLGAGYFHVIEYDYEVDSISVFGEDITEYDILCPESASSYGEKLSRLILEKHGELLDTVSEKGEKNVIGFSFDNTLLPTEYKISKVGGDLVISGANAVCLDKAYEEFVTMISEKENVNISDISKKGSITPPSEYARYISYRDGLDNSYARLSSGEEFRIAYFGGSVTVGTGSTDASKYSWRARTTEWFKKNFPNCEITEIYAPIGASGSHLGRFRVERDVISQKPDLVFVEFSINDKYNGESAQSAEENYESIVRSIRRALPECDIVAVYTIDAYTTTAPYFTQSRAHDKVAQAYGIPSVSVGYALTQKYKLKDRSTPGWNEYFTDIVHMTDKGYGEYFDIITEFLSNELLFKSSHKPVAAKVISDATNKNADDKLFYIPADESHLKNSVGYTYNSGTFMALGQVPYMGYIETSDPDNMIEFDFVGKELSIFVGSFSSGTLEYSVDGGEYISQKIGHTNKPLVLAKNLESGNHKVALKVKFDASKSVKIGMLLVR